MLIIKNYITGSYNCHGTNSAFPDGNVPNVIVEDCESIIRFHDDSDEAKAIMSAYEFEITDGKVHVIKTLEQYKLELKETSEYKHQEILNQLTELDKIITRPMEQMYQDLNTIPTYQPTLNAITQKQQLRLQLSEMEG